MNPEIQHLITTLHSADAHARAEAASALGQFGALYEDTTGLAEEGVPALSAALSDDSRDVRWAAAYALGALGEPDGIAPLVTAFQNAADDTGLRLVIVKALGKIGSEDAQPSLLQILYRAESLCLRTAAAKALERVGTEDALAALHAWKESI